jgi:hypothetical protein
MPCELTEGKFVTSYLDQEELDFSEIDYWEAWDSHGNFHMQREAARWKHWKSQWQWRRERKRRRKAVAAISEVKSE